MVRLALIAAVTSVASIAVPAMGQASKPPATTRAAAATQPFPIPDATTTGVPKGVQLKPSGWIKANVAGMVIEGLDVAGKIEVRAPNVVIRNCRIVPPDNDTGIKIYGEARDTLIEDCEITGETSTNGVTGSNYTARRLHVHHMGSDAFRVYNNATIEACYVHDLGLLPKSHGDGVQMYPTDGSGMRIIGNHIDARGANAALFQVDNGWLVERNYFNGGNYTVQCEGIPENVFRDNLFGPDFKYGAVRVGSGDPHKLTWVNNKYTTTNMPVYLNVRRNTPRGGGGGGEKKSPPAR